MMEFNAHFIVIVAGQHTSLGGGANKIVGVSINTLPMVSIAL